MPKIINGDLFDLVQEKFEENKNRKRERKSGLFFLLRGIIVCSICRYSFCGNSAGNRKYGYYVCTGTRNYSNKKAFCDNKKVIYDVLEEVVWEEVKGLLKDPIKLKHEYHRRIIELQNKDSLTEQNKIKSEKIRLEKSLSRLIDCYAEGLIEKEEFEPRVKKLRVALENTILSEEQLLAHRNQEKQLSLIIGRLEEFAHSVQDQLENITKEKKHEIILAVVKRIEIGKNEINIVFKIDQAMTRHNENYLEHCRSGLDG